MSQLKVDVKHTQNFIIPLEIEKYSENFKTVHNKVYNKSGKGNEFLGWVSLPQNFDETVISRINNDVKALAEKIDVFIVIGIGGSYLGTRAVVDALNSPLGCADSEKKRPQIIYAGHNLSQDYLAALMVLLDAKEYALAVVSKSGTTTEPAVAFRLIKAHLIKKYGSQKAKERIIAITDKAKGALKNLSDKEGYKTYVIPDDVGGRFSVLTPVGLFPIAMAGFDVHSLLKGASLMAETIEKNNSIFENPAALYAVVRNILYNKGKNIEILAAYNPSLNYFIEWWKQLYGESEGKENKGIFPAGVNFTSDLHSMGQYIQEGQRQVFETTIEIINPQHHLTLPFDDEDADGLNFIAGKDIDYINKMAALGTTLAHVEGGVPNINISIERLDEFSLGQLIYFFEIACAFSGYLLGVNPFDQPGVEAYKKNMFALLGKPGFEKETEKIRKNLF